MRAADGLSVSSAHQHDGSGEKVSKKNEIWIEAVVGEEGEGEERDQIEKNKEGESEDEVEEGE